MTAGARKFSLTDLALLGLFAVCGTLAASSSDREFLAVREWRETQSEPKTPTSAVKIEAFASRAVQDLEAVLYAAGPGLCLIAFRPRRGARPRRRGPGHVALIIAGGLSAYSMAHYCWFMIGPTAWTGYKPSNMAGRPPIFWTNLTRGMGYAIAYGIVSAWFYLAVIRGWRGPRLPYERLGIWLGSSWLIASVISWGFATFQ